MSKKGFKSQASSSKAVFGSVGTAFGTQAFGRAPGSILSYVYEPPDLGGIIDAEIVVSFKNLQKKDSTTKAKALEELQAYVNSLSEGKDSLEDTFLDAWAKLFPRTSIDNARRVRQLAYGLQGSIAATCGKRYVKYLPTTVGPWLAGLHDSDRPIARTAQESIKKTFPTEEKQNGVWKAFQASILLYCEDTILQETPQTLSDDRTTGPDDAEAKYSRAVGGALLTVSTSLEKSPQDKNQQAESEAHRQLLHSETVWNLASSKDYFLRKAVYRLLSSAIASAPDLLDMALVGNAMIKALDADQMGSINDFLKCSTSITERQPGLWTRGYTGSSKKPPSKRLCHFLRRGSQGGSSETWKQLRTLLGLIPIEILHAQPTAESQKSSENNEKPPVLLALREGIARKNEIRTPHKDAWLCYVHTASRILRESSNADANNSVIQYCVLPLLRHYVKPTVDEVLWNLTGTGIEDIPIEVVNVASSFSPNALKGEIEVVSGLLIEDVRTSLPEQSKDFSKSQDAIINEFRRWYSLKQRAAESGSSAAEILNETDAAEVDAAAQLLASRGGKPYSAAAILELVAEKICGSSGSSTSKSPSANAAALTKEKLATFADNKLPELMGSPSSVHLLKLLQILETLGPLDYLQASSLERLAEAEQSPSREAAILYLVSSTSWLRNNETKTTLSRLVFADLEKALSTEEGKWSLVEMALKSPSTPDTLVDSIVARMTEALSVSSETDQALSGLEKMASRDQGMLARLVRSDNSNKLATRLFYLSQEPKGSFHDEYQRARASKLKQLFNTVDATDGASKTSPIIDIIRDSVSQTGPESLPIDSLVFQALELLRTTPADRISSTINTMLPESLQWMENLVPFFANPPDEALSISSSLAGAVHLVRSGPNISHLEPKGYDVQGYSAAFRIGLFVAAIANSHDISASLINKSRPGLLIVLSLTAELANDHLSFPVRKPLFQRFNDEHEPRLVDAVASIQKLFSSLIHDGIVSNNHWLKTKGEKLDDEADGQRPVNYWFGRAYAAFVTQLKEYPTQFTVLSNDSAADAEKISKHTRIFSDFALLLGKKPSASLTRLLNELIADLTGANFERNVQPGLQKIVMLNLVLGTENLSLEGIPPQRIVFFVQHLSGVLEASASDGLRSEIFKSFTAFLPRISSIYGEFWETIFTGIATALEAEDSSISLIHAALRLCLLISRLLDDGDVNEDLQEAWATSKSAITSGLILTVQRNADISDAHNLPLSIVNNLLYKQVSLLSDKIKLEGEDLLPILASESNSLQLLAFNILHKTIPAKQEEVSLDSAVSKDFVPRLPEELLSLVLEVPLADDYLDLHDASAMPSSLTRYLLSWKLIFDHWTSASYKVQSAYVTSLKDSNSLSSLLSFTFDLLIGPSDQTTVDPSNFPTSIDTYDRSLFEDPGTETFYLLSHLYYLTLLHAPHLAKDWHTNSCPRALKSRVESWTEKHISPLVISAELSTVAAWTPPESTSENGQPIELAVKTHPRAREASASLPLDDTHVSIRVALPPAYPLAPIAITTSNRVGIDERKWASFLNVAKIVINFSSTSQGLGRVVDGIASWRSNVLGALKGQSECAICYSVVSEDRKVPDKKCGVCRNMFHGVCLYKWFQQSGGSSCPLCRNGFNYA